MIEIKNIYKSISNKHVLQDISWDVEENTINGLVGPNGVGKSTLLRLLSGVYASDSGTISIEDQPVFENEEVKKRIVFVSDDPYFLHQSTLKEMKQFYKIFYPSFNESLYYSLLQSFSVNENEKINTFSKGMKRQVSIILSLAISPDYLFLDEAFDGLDPVMRLTLKRILTDELLNRKFTVIISSHNLRELEDICDNICILSEGKVTMQGNMDDIKQNYHKFQLGFDKPINLKLFDAIHPLHLQQRGKIVTLVAKGSHDEILTFIQSLEPVLIDDMNVNLEEVFVYEMEGFGYGKDI